MHSMPFHSSKLRENSKKVAQDVITLKNAIAFLTNLLVTTLLIRDTRIKKLATRVYTQSKINLRCRKKSTPAKKILI